MGVEVCNGGTMTTAFFPGKFQPPHIGHARTISKLKRRFSKLIIGITEDGPRVVSRDEVHSSFRDIFWQDVEYFLVDGTLTDYKDVKSLPKFDILVTGNDEIVRWAKSLGIVVEKVSRSDGISCSGVKLRELYEEKF
jgi:cytidyltransferase-like protein